jgi:hypothetical protein
MEITLDDGYTDGRGALHKQVTFGKRYDGATLFALNESPTSEIPTQYQLSIVAATITKFGTMTMPVPLDVLLKLYEDDIQALVKAHNQFMADGVGERKVEFVSDSEVKLAFGYEDNGIIYNRVKFGNRLRGLDQVAADNTGFESLRREYFLIGRRIESFTSDDGTFKLDCPVAIEVFEKLDAEDFVTVRIAATRWRQSFRRSE